MSFADAMVWAAAKSAGNQVVYSLDEQFPGDGIAMAPFELLPRRLGLPTTDDEDKQRNIQSYADSDY
jgi:hypothetical protein